MPFMPQLSNSIEPFSNKLPNAQIEIETYEGKSGFVCVCVCVCVCVLAVCKKKFLF